MFLTFVVQSANGCSLGCPFCIIGQRNEISHDSLMADDYAAFIRGVSVVHPITAIAVQGYEPLLPASLPYTEAIRRAGTVIGVPCTLVTNGIYLGRALPLLSQFSLNRIGVSLDASASGRHDRLRGVSGAWAATTRSIREAAKHFDGSGTRVTVISTLMPRRAAYLTGMPALLQDLGVTDWIVNPLLTIGSNRPGKFAGKSASLLDDLQSLQDAAAREGIQLTIDDEFNLLRPALEEADLARYAALKVATLPDDMKISRLLPSGHCSVGADLLSQLPEDAARWRPEEDDPAEFLGGLLNSRNALKKAA